MTDRDLDYQDWAAAEADDEAEQDAAWQEAERRSEEDLARADAQETPK